MKLTTFASLAWSNKGKEQWFNLSDPQAEESLYNSESMRRFAGIEPGETAVPDESTILRYHVFH